MRTLRDALEAALVENPDDLVTHYAYADYLQEQGDPRGEFIALQLALEDPQPSEAERRRSQEKIDELLQTYRREWVGVLADELFGLCDDKPELQIEERSIYDIRFVRGWLDRIARRADIFCSSDLGRLMCRAPETRLLRSLILESDEGTIANLIHSPYLGNLRVLQIGPRINLSEEFELVLEPETNLHKLVAKLSRLEELYLYQSGCLSARLFTLANLTNLRVLEAPQIIDRNYPILLASNPALSNLTCLWLRSCPSQQALDLTGVRAVVQSPHLRNLTHLHLQRSDLGDVGCTEIVTSGILKRLRVLDLRHGEISDSGARILADCPDLRNLELLDVERNALTQAGIDALRRVLGSAVRVESQQTAEELAQRRYMHEPEFV